MLVGPQGELRGALRVEPKAYAYMPIDIGVLLDIIKYNKVISLLMVL